MNISSTEFNLLNTVFVIKHQRDSASIKNHLSKSSLVRFHAAWGDCGPEYFKSLFFLHQHFVFLLLSHRQGKLLEHFTKLKSTKKYFSTAETWRWYADLNYKELHSQAMLVLQMNDMPHAIRFLWIKRGLMGTYRHIL